MHEYSVVDELVAGLLPRLEAHQGTVTDVFLRKGELRILSDRALCNAFEILSKDTRLEHARLVVETVDAMVACHHCGYEGSPETFHDEAYHIAVPILSCPTCGLEVEIVSGRELFVDRVSIRGDG